MYIYKLYSDDSSQSQSSTRDLRKFTGIEGQSGKNMCQEDTDTGNFYSSYIGINVCGTAYENGVWSMASMLRQWFEYCCTVLTT